MKESSDKKPVFELRDMMVVPEEVPSGWKGDIEPGDIYQLDFNGANAVLKPAPGNKNDKEIILSADQHGEVIKGEVFEKIPLDRVREIIEARETAKEDTASVLEKEFLENNIPDSSEEKRKHTKTSCASGSVFDSIPTF